MELLPSEIVLYITSFLDVPSVNALARCSVKLSEVARAHYVQLLQKFNAGLPRWFHEIHDRLVIPETLKELQQTFFQLPKAIDAEVGKAVCCFGDTGLVDHCVSTLPVQTKNLFFKCEENRLYWKRKPSGSSQVYSCHTFNRRDLTQEECQALQWTLFIEVSPTKNWLLSPTKHCTDDRRQLHFVHRFDFKGTSKALIQKWFQQLYSDKVLLLRTKYNYMNGYKYESLNDKLYICRVTNLSPITFIDSSSIDTIKLEWRNRMQQRIAEAKTRLNAELELLSSSVHYGAKRKYEDLVRRCRDLPAHLRAKRLHL